MEAGFCQPHTIALFEEEIERIVVGVLFDRLLVSNEVFSDG